MILREMDATCRRERCLFRSQGPSATRRPRQDELQNAGACLCASIPCVCGRSCNQFLDMSGTMKHLFYNPVTVWQCYAKNV